jgi:hypothetical protein
VQNSAFVHKQKSCPDLSPGSRVTSALAYARGKLMILLSLTGLSTEGGHPYLLLSMLYTVIGCKPEMPDSKKNFVRGRSEQRGHCKHAFRSVENPMHIHRMECAKARFFQPSANLFTIAAPSAPGFSSQFQIA